MLDRVQSLGLVGLLDESEATAIEMLSLDAGDDVDRLAERIANLYVQMQTILKTANGDLGADKN